MTQKTAALSRITKAALRQPQANNEDTLSLYDAIHAALEDDCPQLAELAGKAASSIRAAEEDQLSLFQHAQESIQS